METLSLQFLRREKLNLPTSLRFCMSDIDHVIKTREINGQHYIIVLYPKSDPFKQLIVFHNEDGKPTDNIEHPNHIPKQYKEIVRLKRTEKRIKREYDGSLERFISEGVNEAVSKVEGRLERKQELQDSIEAVLEATKEVHEGIDYQLQNE